jgi:hypothetical protein
MQVVVVVAQVHLVEMDLLVSVVLELHHQSQEHL